MTMPVRATSRHCRPSLRPSLSSTGRLECRPSLGCSRTVPVHRWLRALGEFSQSSRSTVPRLSTTLSRHHCVECLTTSAPVASFSHCRPTVSVRCLSRLSAILRAGQTLCNAVGSLRRAATSADEQRRHAATQSAQSVTWSRFRSLQPCPSFRSV